MSTPIDVDPASLRRVDQDLGDLLQRAITDLQNFDAELTAQGEPWGDDDIGSVIGEVYKGVYAMAMNCFNTNLDAIDDLGERLSITADGYEVTDEQAAEDMQQVQQIASSINLPL
ncbi:hypothetical protein Rhe02_74390 [Rhizocola hellebori]|uniref:Uncharacterized protein n=1 Tax=Rhizocola hellebori TaxID=1392758 RepID=A0A8J3VKB7_9ACTN|nr:hypothetical protein [Rhizocola hellebori]GIH09372.1 hypothetical protein Rhe02_74390 [Rhizocola hellebori]